MQVEWSKRFLAVKELKSFGEVSTVRFGARSFGFDLSLLAITNDCYLLLRLRTGALRDTFSKQNMFHLTPNYLWFMLFLFWCFISAR